MKNVFITGASRGIGRELTYQYASTGANLFLTARNTDALERISIDVNSKGGNAAFAKCDVANREECRKAIGLAFKSLRTIDIAVLNAGMSLANWVSKFNIDDFKQTVETNLFSIAYGLEFLVPIMMRQGYGTIAGVSSIADGRGYPGSGAYCSSKAAVTKLLESARIELKKYNIKVITVKPGFVRTDLTAKNEFMMPFLMEAEKAARRIRRGIEKNKSVVQFPFGTVILSMITKSLPNFLYDYLAIKFRPEPSG